MTEEIEVTEDDIIDETTEKVTEVVDKVIENADEVADVLEDLGLLEDGKYDKLIALVQKHKNYVFCLIGILVAGYFMIK